MSTSTPPIPSSSSERYALTVHNAAIAALIACPILALLPPRKLDIYTLGLVGVTGYSGNHLVREWSGRSVWGHVSGRRTAQLQQQQQQEEGSTVEQGELGTRSWSAVAEMQRAGRAEGSRESWKMRRQREIREEVEEGKGFGDMIVDQIWEVWNQGKPRDEDQEG